MLFHFLRVLLTACVHRNSDEFRYGYDRGVGGEVETRRECNGTTKPDAEARRSRGRAKRVESDERERLEWCVERPVPVAQPKPKTMIHVAGERAKLDRRLEGIAPIEYM